MKYFTIQELTKTSTGIKKEPNAEQKANLTTLVTELLDPVREQWGKPIRVNSGYRSLEVNKAVKGAASSQHMTGEAADITTGSITDNKRLFGMIKTDGYVFDQLINENGGQWLHVSYRRGKNRQQVLNL